MPRFAHPIFALLVLLAALPVVADDPPQPQPEDQYASRYRAVLMRTCGECHSPDDAEGGLNFLKAESAQQVGENRGIWSQVVEQLRNRTMPPADEPQPTEEERLEIASWIDRWLRETACTGEPFAGRVTARRLNRYEYDNTIRDLVGLDLSFSETFPRDGSGGEGFNNNGETLFLPTMLMERYLDAADEILDRVIVSPPLDRSYSAAELLPLSKGDGESKKTQNTRTIKGGESASVLISIYDDGDYVFTIEVASVDSAAGTLAIEVDGIAASELPLDDLQARQSEDAETSTIENELHLSRGLHRVGLSIVGDEGNVTVRGLRIEQRPEKTSDRKQQLHDRIFAVEAGSRPDEQRKAAREIVTTFARRAFRRPLESAEVDGLMQLYDRGAERGDPFVHRVRLPLKAILVSPHFLFRVEQDHPGDGPVRVSDHELATRLSYFLWGSMPDDELFALADAGTLSQEPVLLEQVERMLGDEKSRGFLENFTGQWLGTGEVGIRVAPDTNFFRPAYSTELAADLREEAVQLMRYVIEEDRSVMELLDCDYVFLNERLAKHYEIEHPGGEGFVKIRLEDDRRGGVLGLGAVHMLTSYSRRTSPVLRGGWVLETLFGTRIPAPPADVPPLPGGEKETKKQTVRQRLEAHRADPTCAACHRLIDPIGFGLENFDVLGRWRSEEGDQPIDASGEMPGGETFSGPAELRQVLLQRQDDFVHTLCERMLGFALGRSLVDADQCTVEQLAQRLHEDDYRVRNLIEGIVLSTPFQYRQGTGESAETGSSAETDAGEPEQPKPTAEAKGESDE